MDAKAVFTKGLSELSIGEALGLYGITVYPLYKASSPQHDYLLLEEAEHQGLIEVTDTGIVSELWVKNRAPNDVLIVAGAQLTGGLQNRIVSTTILIAAGKSIRVPASCVEKGRWSPRLSRGRDFGLIPVHEGFKPRFTTSYPAPPGIRGQALIDTHRSLRRMKKAIADQVAVWHRVSGVLRHRGIYSPTEALDDAYSYLSSSLERYVRGMPYPAGAVGALVASRGAICWAEMLSQPRAMENLWPGLVASWALDLAEKQDGFTLESPSPAEFLECVKTAPAEKFKAVGLGSEIRFELGHLAGSALVYQGEMIHLSVYVLS